MKSFPGGVFFLIGLLIQSCTLQPVKNPQFNDTLQYRTSPPPNDVASQLKRLLQSVKKISAIAYYTTYYFSPDQQLTAAQVSVLDLKKEALDQAFFNESSSGTATILQYDFTRIAVLTCAHVGEYPDTVYSYFDPEDPTSFLSSVSVKTRSEFFVNEIPGGDELQLLAKDDKSDLALYGREYASPRKRELFRFPYKLGMDRDMNWGVFVYLAGFPMGIQTVTSGMVSQPRGIRKGTFVIDANFNPGFSGGVVLAVRPGSDTFEWVGIVKSVSATTYYRLTPDSQFTKERRSHKPYGGPIYLEQVSDINYGITYAVSAGAIRNFLKTNAPLLEARGFDLSYFID